MNLGATLIGFPILVATGIIASRILGPSGKGIYQFLFLVIKVLIPIGMFGMASGFSHAIASKKFRVCEVALTTIAVAVGLSLITVLLVLLLWKFSYLGQTGQEIQTRELVVVLCACPFFASFTLLLALLKGASDFAAANIALITQTLGSAVFLTIYLVQLDLGILGASLAILSESLLGSLIVGYLIYSRHKAKLTINKEYVLYGFRYGRKAWIGNLSAQSNDRLDQLILGFFASPEALGIYSVAASLSKTLNILPNAIAPVFFAKVASGGGIAIQSTALSSIHRILFALNGVLAIALFGSSGVLVPMIYGVGFQPAVMPLLILLPGFFGYSVTRRLTTRFLDAMGLPQLSSVIQVGSAALGVASYLVLVPAYGISGAAIGSSLSYFFATLLSLYFVFLHSNCNAADLFVPRVNDFHSLLGALKRVI